MFTEKERAKWRERVARWRNGELVYDAGKIVEKSDNTSVQKQEPVLPIKRRVTKSPVVPESWVEKQQQSQPTVKSGNTYKTTPRPQTFAGRVSLVVGGDWVKTDMASAGVSQVPIIGLLNGALDFGYDLNNSTHALFDTDAHTNTAMSGIALLPYVRNGLKMLKGKTWAVRLRNAYDSAMTKSNTADDVNKALKAGRTSDAVLDSHMLDWSTWSKGGPISKEHLLEYADIERNAKTTGTWLQMPDGSSWQGDPRSWVQLMSKDGQKILPKRYFHGSDDFYKNGDIDVTPEVKGTKSIWLSSNPSTARTYTTGDHKVYEIGIPKDTKLYTVDAEGRNWRAVMKDGDDWLDTNTVASNPEWRDGMVLIKNVWDQGPNKIPTTSKYYAPIDPKLKMDDWARAAAKIYGGDDLITNSMPRKSLLYNNGDFNLSDPNIYRILAPAVLAGGAGYSLFNKYAE